MSTEFWLPLIEALVVSGGLVTIFTLRQTKEAKKLDNAQKLCDEYVELMAKYKQRSEEQDATIDLLTKQCDELRRQNADLIQRYEARIAEREKQYAEHISTIEDSYRKQIEELRSASELERASHAKEIEGLKKSIASLNGRILNMQKTKKAEKAE